MVQVDVFWSYAIGAGFAMAAARQLRVLRPWSGSGIRGASHSPSPTGALQSVNASAAERPPGGAGFSSFPGLAEWLENGFFTRAVLFLALIFAPSGLYLLWNFTSWETMHAGDRSMPAWLVTLFAITNVTQGMLGFVTAARFIRSDRPYLAYLQFIAGYLGMFFILVHGWDGTGYQRFFSPTREAFLDHWTWSTAAQWLSSDVALTLYGMGVILLPVMLGMMARWIRDGVGLETGGAGLASRAGAPSLTRSTVLVLVSALGGALGSAIVASLLIHQLGWLVGALTAGVVIGGLGVRPGGYFHRLFEALMWIEPGEKSASPSPRIL